MFEIPARDSSAYSHGLDAFLACDRLDSPNTVSRARPSAISVNGEHALTRVELCGDLSILKAEKERLQRVTAQQRAELQAITEDTKRLRILQEAHVVCQSCSQRCLTELAQLEVNKLGSERQRLKQELSALREEAFCSAMEAKHCSERESWEAERTHLERELAIERAQLAARHGEFEARRALIFVAFAQEAAINALQEELDTHRAARILAEKELNAVEMELASCRNKGQLVAGGASLALGMDASKGKGKAVPDAEELRFQFRHEVEARRREARDLWVANADREVMHKELQEVIAQGDTLRAGLRQALASLEHIQRESEEARNLVVGLPGPAVRRGCAAGQPPQHLAIPPASLRLPCACGHPGWSISNSVPSLGKPP